MKAARKQRCIEVHVPEPDLQAERRSAVRERRGRVLESQETGNDSDSFFSEETEKEWKSRIYRFFWLIAPTATRKYGPECGILSAHAIQMDSHDF
jgi:hypothetical protein